MNFVSDNVTGAAPEILAAIEAANADSLMPYGNDDVTRAAEAKVDILQGEKGRRHGGTIYTKER